MTSSLRPLVQYLIPTEFFCFYYAQIWLRNLALLAAFHNNLMTMQKWLTFCWATLYIGQRTAHANA